MRRLLPLLAIAAVLGLSGCSLLGGGITKDWPAMPAAQQFKPESGVCHGLRMPNGRLVLYAPIPCTKWHVAETYFVGDLPKTVAGLSSWPERGDDAADPAGAACSKVASDKFGRNWLDFQLEIMAVWPGESAWDAGARWLRCDVVVPKNIYRSRGEIFQEGPLTSKTLDGLALGCFNYHVFPDAILNDLYKSPCDVAHNAEYAGSFNMPPGTKKPKGEEAWDAVHSGCYSVIAEFVGVRPSAVKTGTLSIPESSTWAEEGGDNSVRCYLLLGEKQMTGSAKGTRGVGIPK